MKNTINTTAGALLERAYEALCVTCEVALRKALARAGYFKPIAAAPYQCHRRDESTFRTDCPYSLARALIENAHGRAIGAPAFPWAIAAVLGDAPEETEDQREALEDLEAIVKALEAGRPRFRGHSYTWSAVERLEATH